MTLDLQRGTLLSASRLKTSDLGILRLRTLRIVSLSERAVGLQLIEMEIEKGEIDITSETSFEGVNLGLVSEHLEQDLGVWRTHSSGKGLAMAPASSLQIDGQNLPVSGTGAQAANKDLVVFASGDEAAFERCREVLAGMSRAQKYVGAFGNGSRMKFIANHLVTIHNLASAEAFVLGEMAGLDPALVFDVIVDSAGSSRMFQIRGPMMVRGQYDELGWGHRHQQAG